MSVTFYAPMVPRQRGKYDQVFMHVTKRFADNSTKSQQIEKK